MSVLVTDPNDPFVKAYRAIQNLEQDGQLLPTPQATQVVGTIDAKTGAFTWQIPTFKQTYSIAGISHPTAEPPTGIGQVRIAAPGGGGAPPIPGLPPPTGPNGGGPSTITVGTHGLLNVVVRRECHFRRI